MKIAKACTQCRLGKRKCIPTRGACLSCQRRGLCCSLLSACSVQRACRPVVIASKDSEKQQYQKVSREASETVSLDGPDGSDCPLSISETCHLVDVYIRLIHDKPHTLFHPPTLKRQVLDESLPRQILYGILAMAAHLSEDQPRLQQRAPEFAQAARTHLKRHIDHICLENVQACILVGNICSIEGDRSSKAFWFGVAIRMAVILQLPERNDSSPFACSDCPPSTSSYASVSTDPISREVRLRVWWSLYMIDRWAAAATGLARQLANDTDNPLPMDEQQFNELTPASHPGSLAQTTTIQRPGLWGYMVLLAKIFACIQDLHRHHAGHVDHVDGHAHAEAETYRLAGELDAFLLQLPESARLTEDNLRRHAAQGHGSTLVSLHLGFHHYATLLYFPYLDQQLGQAGSHLVFASRCKNHAAAFSDLLLLSRQIPGCTSVHLVVAHMAVVSSAALLHTLLFGDHVELPPTRQRLETNFTTMVQLGRYWPAVSRLMDRLFAFQRACMWSADPNTHKIDRWMVRFLLNHSLPVPEKHSLSAATGSDELLLQRGQVAGETLSILRTDTDS